MESNAENQGAEVALDLVFYEENLGSITTNAQELLAYVEKKCAGYKAENYNSDNIAEAKRDRADLNALAKSVAAKRLERERKFMEPFLPFKDICSKIDATIKDASGRIDGVVKDVEAREKEEKRGQLEIYFDGFGTKLVTFEKIFEPVWLNKGTKIKDAEAAIFAKVEKVKSDLLLLDRVPVEDKQTVKAYYLETLNVEQAFAQADQLQANRDRLARAAEAKEIPAPAEEKIPDAEPVEEKEPEPDAPSFTPDLLPAIVERVFRVRCTRQKLNDLASFMAANEIEFNKVEG